MLLVCVRFIPRTNSSTQLRSIGRGADFFAEILDEHVVEFSSVGCQQPSIQVLGTTKSTPELGFTHSIDAENLARPLACEAWRAAGVLTITAACQPSLPAVWNAFAPCRAMHRSTVVSIGGGARDVMKSANASTRPAARGSARLPAKATPRIIPILRSIVLRRHAMYVSDRNRWGRRFAARGTRIDDLDLGGA